MVIRFFIKTIFYFAAYFVSIKDVLESDKMPRIWKKKILLKVQKVPEWKAGIGDTGLYDCSKKSRNEQAPPAQVSEDAA